jgi:hypothetical protein
VRDEALHPPGGARAGRGEEDEKGTILLHTI